MFCSLYIIIRSVYLIFFPKNNYLFVLLDYLFPGSKINYLILKINLKKSSKHRQVWFCFENLVIRKIVRPNLISMLGLIVLDSFCGNTLHVGDVTILSPPACMHLLLYFTSQRNHGSGLLG